MKTKTLLKTILVALFFTTINSQAKAQIVYTDIEPDTIIFVPSIIDSTKVFNIDVDSNSNFDLAFKAKKYKNTNNQISFEITVDDYYYYTGGKNKVSGWCDGGGYYPFINYSDIINANIIWHGYTYILFSNSSLPFSCDVPIGDFYLGMKFLNNTDTLYGWVRCSATNNSITIKDYAYNTVPNMYILAGQKPLGIENNTLDSKINIYTNNNTLEVTFNKFPNPQGSIKIYNNIGQIIKTAAITGIYNNISLAGISSGLYIVQVQTQDGVINKKVFFNAQ